MIIPKGINFELWARQLNIDFPNDNIPIPLNGEKDLKPWGMSLIQCSSFAGKDIPVPEDNETFEDWAMKVYKLMNDQNNKKN